MIGGGGGGWDTDIPNILDFGAKPQVNYANNNSTNN